MHTQHAGTTCTSFSSSQHWPWHVEGSLEGSTLLLCTYLDLRQAWRGPSCELLLMLA